MLLRTHCAGRGGSGLGVAKRRMHPPTAAPRNPASSIAELIPPAGQPVQLGVIHERSPARAPSTGQASLPRADSAPGLCGAAGPRECAAVLAIGGLGIHLPGRERNCELRGRAWADGGAARVIGRRRRRPHLPLPAHVFSARGAHQVIPCGVEVLGCWSTVPRQTRTVGLGRWPPRSLARS